MNVSLPDGSDGDSGIGVADRAGAMQVVSPLRRCRDHGRWRFDYTCADAPLTMPSKTGFGPDHNETLDSGLETE